MAQMVEGLPVMWDTWVPSLGGEDPLEEGVATLSSVLAWKSHGQRSLVGYSTWGGKESDRTEQLHFHFFIRRELLCVRVSSAEHCTGVTWTHIRVQIDDFFTK